MKRYIIPLTLTLVLAAATITVPLHAQITELLS
jgi:hypothetical protein